MSAIFCCSSITAYRPQQLDHEQKFSRFMDWEQRKSAILSHDSSLIRDAQYAVQVVRQANYGPQESVRYFVPTSAGSAFEETNEDALIEANFEKVDSYKNFKCRQHDKFFEVNLYQISPTNAHHWRANLARPSRDIDLALKQKTIASEPTGCVGTTDENVGPEKPGYDASKPHPHSSLSQEQQCTTALDTTGLKTVLRFLLPKVGTGPDSSIILSLLSIDWANERFGLSLDLEKGWKEALFNPNIAAFLGDCLRSCACDFEDFGELEGCVALAVRKLERSERDQGSGASRLQKIVQLVLDSTFAPGWLTEQRGNITRIISASRPNEQLLEYCQQKKGKMQQSQGDDTSVDARVRYSLLCEPKAALADRSFHKRISYVDGSDDEGVYNFECDYDSSNRYYDYSDQESEKDFTACDKECGYCGKCDY